MVDNLAREAYKRLCYRVNFVQSRVLEGPKFGSIRINGVSTWTPSSGCITKVAALGLSVKEGSIACT